MQPVHSVFLPLTAQFLVLLITGCIITGCGQSPLLHHLDAGEPRNSSIEEQGMGSETNPASNPGACALAFPKQKLCANIHWNERPVVGQAVSFRLQFKSAVDNKKKDPTGPVHVELWMPSMGHGSSPVVVTRAEGDPNDVTGLYNVTNVLFLMNGDWDIRFRVSDGAQVEETKIGVRL